MSRATRCTRMMVVFCTKYSYPQRLRDERHLSSNDDGGAGWTGLIDRFGDGPGADLGSL